MMAITAGCTVGECWKTNEVLQLSTSGALNRGHPETTPIACETVVTFAPGTAPSTALVWQPAQTTRPAAIGTLAFWLLFAETPATYFKLQTRAVAGDEGVLAATRVDKLL
jgi:hypothetical protein